MHKVLVTGGNGQVGMELKELSRQSALLDYAFFSGSEWDITNDSQSKKIISEESPRILINLAAYTKVDQAEKEKDLCYSVNAKAPKMLASLTRENGVIMIHISSDYVFHSQHGPPIKPNQILNPAGVYANSKAMAEKEILEKNPDSIIIRSSWIYSTYGHNFVKTMIGLSKKHTEIKVVNDQIGSPTYAADLAEFINLLCNRLISGRPSAIPNFLHYSNKGSVSWFDFAKEIFKLTNAQTHVLPITTEEFNAPAPRPKYSVLDCTETESIFEMEIPGWQESLMRCISKLNI